jgi:hypothetical protein
VKATPTIAVLLVAAAAAGSRAQGEWVLIDRDLKERRVELTQLRDGVVMFSDEEGRARTAPVSDLLAIVHERPPEERPARELPWLTQQMEMFGPDAGLVEEEEEASDFVPWLELTNGEKWIGSLAGAAGESLTWTVAGSLPREAPLDRVRIAAINGPIDGAGWAGVEDRVVLLNGDLVDGFIASIGEAVLIESGSGVIEVPVDRAAGVLLANPPTPPSGALAWLHDGSVIQATSVEIAVTGRVSLGLGSEAPEATHQAPATDVLALLFAPGLITGLAELEPASISFPPERLWARAPAARAPAQLGVGDLDLVGPVTLVWDLARPAARLGATATLPPAMWAWGDCEIVVRAGDGTELLRERLRADRPTVEINVPLGGARRVSIEVASGAGGPVQDGVVLLRPMIRWQDGPRAR